MRAPVQKMRPRRTGKQSASKAVPDQGGQTGDQPAVGTGRPAHVRNRLIGAVAVVAAAIAGAGAPSVLAASGELNDAQNLVTLAERTQQALTLAHALADERDEVTGYVAAGRPGSQAPGEERRARVDRQVEELQAGAPAGLRADLDEIAAVRRAVLTGRSTALEAHQAYAATIAELHALAEELAGKLPPGANDGAHALAELDTAVQQSAAARGLLLAALRVPASTRTVTDPVTGLPTTTTTSSAAAREQRDELTAAAQRARVRSDAALEDFRETAPGAARSSYDSTVTGPEVASADDYLGKLTDQPTLSGSELNTGAGKLDAALSARIELMRGVEASLNDRRTKALVQQRDEDVTTLEIRIAVLGVIFLVAVGVATAMARTLTRPLAVLRIGSARVATDPASEEPVRFTGRNDEFAQVVRSVNALHAHALALHERLAPLEGDRKHLIGQRAAMAQERDRLRAELTDAAAHLERVRHSIHGTFVNLALRTLGLVERQLAVIEGLEEREQDPEQLATLFKLDHFATVVRRHSENLLVLAGAEHGQQHAGPVPLVDVVRAAVSEIERYDRVRIAALPQHTHIAGFAADDLSHLLAELLENATSFTPPEQPVEISGWLLENGEVMLSVQDDGIGVTAGRLEQLNSRLRHFDPNDPYDQEGGEGLGLGLYVVARLAHRHGVQVRLREQKQGGVAAVVVVPKPLLATAPATAVPTSRPVTADARTTSLPGADAEVNSNMLHGRSSVSGREPEGDGDPLVEAAERALKEHAAGERQDAEVIRDDQDIQGDTAVRQDESADPEEPAETPQAPEAVSETTMELLVPVPRSDAAPGSAPAAGPYAIGPDRHDHSSGASPDEPPRFTGKGLPKRTPRIAAPTTVPQPRAGGVNAEELRRRLGGFHRGAKDGRRDVEAETAEQTGAAETPAARRNEQDPVGTSGATSEEASS
jgi:signal transduction histidine kinase